MDQTCLANSGGFAPISFPLFQGVRFGRGRMELSSFVRRPVVLITTSGGTISAVAAKAATPTIPIVFATGADPVESGLVISLNRPGGNITGVSFLAKQTDPKRLELLHEIAPKATTIAVLVNPTNPNVAAKLSEVQAAGHAIGRQLFVACQLSPAPHKPSHGLLPELP
jgi:ABC-type uncharacterized transport system substrate-binding protein